MRMLAGIDGVELPHRRFALAERREVVAVDHRIVRRLRSAPRPSRRCARSSAASRVRIAAGLSVARPRVSLLREVRRRRSDTATCDCACAARARRPTRTAARIDVAALRGAARRGSLGDRQRRLAPGRDTGRPSCRRRRTTPPPPPAATDGARGRARSCETAPADRSRRRRRAPARATPTS